MSWIFEHSEEGATGEIAELYETLRKSRGKVSNILKVHSLRPAALRHHLDLYMGLMFGPGGLSRCEREMIAVVVSRANQCEYCVAHHREALARYRRDENELNLICQDHRAAALSSRERSLLDYAEQLTKSPAQATAEMIERMRTTGLGDADILLTNLIVAYFNFVNRIAMGLGVTFSADEVQGYQV
jgi:uncharacterized peroxidase-related enzyme